MKKLKITILSAVLAIFGVATSVCAQTSSSSNINNYKPQFTEFSQFRVTDTGIIEDTSGVKIGWIESDGTLKNNAGEVVGKVVKNATNPEVFDFSDKSGKKIATIDKNGLVKDVNGTVLYTVSAPDKNGYCTVYNNSGQAIGLVHEKHKHRGACLFHSTKKS